MLVILSLPRQAKSSSKSRPHKRGICPSRHVAKLPTDLSGREVRAALERAGLDRLAHGDQLSALTDHALPAREPAGTIGGIDEPRVLRGLTSVHKLGTMSILEHSHLLFPCKNTAGSAGAGSPAARFEVTS
jgi:hypothetical protein